MNFSDIFVRAPVNRQAAAAVSQRGVAAQDAPLSRDELIYIINRLTRKGRLLKDVLGIKNKSQHKNLMWKTNKGLKNYRAEREPRALVEYRRVGREIERMKAAITEIRRIQKLAEQHRPAAGWAVSLK